MSYLAKAEFHAAPLTLRSGRRRDLFPYYTILLGVMLATCALIYGAPPLPAAETPGALAVFGP